MPFEAFVLPWIWPHKPAVSSRYGYNHQI